MKRWLCWLLIAAATAALLAACAGDSGDEAAPAEGEEAAQDTPVAAQEGEPTDQDDLISLLEQSSEAQQSVESFRGRMDSDITMTGMSMSMKVEYAFRTPDEVYMDMQTGPLSSEMVMTEGRIFMKATDEDWEETPAEDVLPFDPQSLMEMANVTEPDLELLENVKIDEGEVIDGVDTVHISFEIDVEKAMAQASDILGGGFSDLLGETGEMYEFSGNLPMDVWLGEDDKLPRRMAFQMEGTFLGEDYGMKTTMDFFDYGEPVDIPSLEEMLEKIGG
jgi:hypothetical protein